MTPEELKDVLKAVPFKVKITGTAIVTNPPEESDGDLLNTSLNWTLPG